MSKYSVQFVTTDGTRKSAEVVASDYRDAADWVIRNCANVDHILGVTFIE